MFNYDSLAFRKSWLGAIRIELRRREKFFEHVRVLSCYHTDPNWEELMCFMMRGLEIAYDSG